MSPLPLQNKYLRAHGAAALSWGSVLCLGKRARSCQEPKGSVPPDDQLITASSVLLQYWLMHPPTLLLDSKDDIRDGLNRFHVGFLLVRPSVCLSD